jgi:hypothetical protein
MKVLAEHVAQGTRVFIGEGQLHRTFSATAGDTAPSAQPRREYDRASRGPLALE